MQVKIISCTDKSNWYANKIGQIFDCDKPTKESTMVNVKVFTAANTFVWRVVEKKDCELF
jgi:hypothetical protein